MVDIEFEAIDNRVVVRLKREYKSEALQRSYMSNELIIIVPDTHLEDIKADFQIYSRLPKAEQEDFIGRLRVLPRYSGRLLETPVSAD